MDLIPADIVAKIPANLLSVFNTIALAVFIGGRAYHTIVNGGGLYGIYTALVYGKPTPRPVTSEPDKTDQK